jgi:folate-binding protein YgfZ
MTLSLEDRAVIGVAGPDALTFLQGLVTNDLRRLAPDTPLYSALLTPQGKILFDFLMFAHDGDVLVDCPAEAREALAKRLSLYRLRAKVEIAAREDLTVAWHPEGGTAQAAGDPRHPGLGSRALLPGAEAPARPGAADFMVRRLDLGIPEGRDFGQDRMFALDANLDELHAVSFGKGCYVGQEMTARMKHRGTARKRLLGVVSLDGSDLPGEGTVVTAEGKEVAMIQSAHGHRGFALARLDRLEEAGSATLRGGESSVQIIRPGWLFP